MSTGNAKSAQKAKEQVEEVNTSYLPGLCSHEIKRHLLLGEKQNCNKSRPTLKIALTRKIHIVKALIFSIVTFGCES